MNGPVASLPWLASLVLGLGVTLGCEPCLRLWDTLALRRLRELAPVARTVGIPEVSVRLGMRAWGLALLGVPPLVLWLFGSPVLVPVVAGLIYQAPRWILQIIIQRRRRRLRDQLVGVCFALANTARAGLGLAQGIQHAGREAPEPIRSELLRIVRDFSRGRSLSQAIGDVSDRLDLNGFRMFAAAVLSCLEHGGPLTETLDGLALAVQESQRLQMKMDVQSASGRLTLWALGVFPLIFLSLNYLIEPTSTWLLLTTVAGQVCLTIIILLILGSVRMGLRITRFEHLV
jgi:Flp pilus assembly protein TadB